MTSNTTNSGLALIFQDGILEARIASMLPEGCRVSSVVPHGFSFWATSGTIEVELTSGESQKFFVKVLNGDQGKNAAQSEFESMKAIHAVCPTFVPEPIAWGALSGSLDTHFYLCEHRDMKDAKETMPDPLEFTANLAALHQRSISPTGKFGFHLETYFGYLPQATNWEDSWEVYFSKSLRRALDHEIAAKGNDPELDELAPIIFNKVIPRLLRPLETDGRSVKPSLVHGDLWYANSGVDKNTGASLIFDACCSYAHNEYEFGQWMPSCNLFKEEYLAAYRSHVEVSDPVEDYQGRLDLYKLKFNTHVSALFSSDQGLRKQMIGDMRDLAARYGAS